MSGDLDQRPGAAERLPIKSEAATPQRAAPREPGERTRGFDVRMLADLEKTLKDSGERAALAPSPSASGGRDGSSPAPPSERAPAPAPEKAAAPSSTESTAGSLRESGTLELVPEEPSERDASTDVIDRLLAEARTPDAPDEKPKKRSGRIKTAMQVKEFSLDTNDDWRGMAAHEENALADESSEEELPKDPAQAALVKHDRTGDPAELAEAKRIFSETMATAPEGTARAFAQAGLARVELLAGNASRADQLARVALDKDPGNPFAVEIIIRAQRGDADRLRLAAGLARGRTLIAARRWIEAWRNLERLASEYLESPQPRLLAAYLASLEGDTARFEHCLAQAWERTPGSKHPDLLLGGIIDVDLAHLLALQGREQFKRLDLAFLKHTVEDVDSKGNVVAGAYRIAIALARIVIVKGHHSRKTVRKCWTTIGSGLIGLQYYDAALEALDRAAALRPDGEEVKAIESERGFAGQMRRAFDKSGVKARLGKYACVGTQILSCAARDRLAAATKDKTEKSAEFLRASDEVARIVACDERVRDEVKKAAESLSKADPIEPLELVDAEIGAVRLERARLAEAAARAGAGKQGLLSKLSSVAASAVDRVASAAKDAQLELRETQLVARRDEVVRQLGVTITKELRDQTWHSTQLRLFVKRAATLEAFVDYHAEEERQAKMDLEALARTI
jgi:hypothetical protein